MTKNTRYVLVDAAAFLVVVAFGAWVFDHLLLGVLAGLIVAGGTDTMQRRGRQNGPKDS